ncbi:MAG: DNA protecting protein DprA [Candidatus Doudnabacteria bacterium RIFCSPHIGHO2_01_FULL_49_9]|uniref:DNA protecting protein DprA n=1 Tax=Candidatus Doudnabacteria bacterium RIFCSPHIGHO2_01_FULL_49_9 TaxID=1817827 RepID=A0A1F5P4E4_9BACT|nr:MAG: DNA protecting protein DprA [Candidatus Doudnabacteria bacterium RIFCSPHIGHO2_01_FULL_49_9]
MSTMNRAISEQPIGTIRVGSPSYPEMLKNIPKPPEEFFVRGNLDAVHPAVAIVGTRKATAVGLKTAEEFARKLGEAGFAIISGLALGIDSAAHRGALKAGAKTVAVLGCGIDKVYPAHNEILAEEIIKCGGAVISEYPAGHSVRKYNFLDRNRIISGLALATIVVESPARSGSLRTAGCAAEQGRTVFVIPGPISHPNYEGSHALIRDGATLVTRVEEIISDLGLGNMIARRARNTGENNKQNALIEILRRTGAPLNLDEIIELTGLGMPEIASLLTALAIEGKVAENGGRYEII